MRKSVKQKRLYKNKIEQFIIWLIYHTLLKYEDRSHLYTKS